jgi:hypothetical protein
MELAKTKHRESKSPIKTKKKCTEKDKTEKKPFSLYASFYSNIAEQLRIKDHHELHETYNKLMKKNIDCVLKHSLLFMNQFPKRKVISKSFLSNFEHLYGVKNFFKSKKFSKKK